VNNLYKGNIPNAKDQFKSVIEKNPRNLHALLGRGAVEVENRDFEAALNTYQSVLQIHPRAPAEVRLGLGICYYHLGDVEKARLCFKRVLELDPESTKALIALSILERNERAGSKEGFLLLSEANKKNPNDPLILNHVANYCFLKAMKEKKEGNVEECEKQLEFCMEHAKGAYLGTDVAKIKAESCFYIGRTHHYQVRVPLLLMPSHVVV